jgi:alkanesulfonate monooxygenase SsuD/methylene tetrahydromethanopterin reductase-like flavin-dependent oxidoreductase (luciferase family)
VLPLLPLTRRLEFLVAFRPGFVLPTLAAQQAASFQRLSGGRLRLNIVTGGDPVEQRAYGDFLDHDDRYARTGEFLQVLRRCFTGERFDFAGAHVQVQGAGLVRPLDAPPPIYLGGASPAAEEVTARWVDRYLTWGEPPAMVAPRLERVREKAAAAGRTVRFGMRLHVVSRDTPEQAWAEADRILAGMPAAAIAATQERYARMDSVGARGGRTPRWSCPRVLDGAHRRTSPAHRPALRPPGRRHGHGAGGQRARLHARPPAHEHLPGRRRGPRAHRRRTRGGGLVSPRVPAPDPAVGPYRSDRPAVLRIRRERCRSGPCA